MTSEQIKIFKRFLKELGIYSAFLSNLRTSRFDKWLTTNEYLICKKKYDAISESFDWSHSPEGHTFWQRVYEAWNSVDVNSPDVAEKLISFKKIKETLRSLRNKNANAIL